MHLVGREINLFLMSRKLERGPMAEVSGKENLMPEDGMGSLCRRASSQEVYSIKAYTGWMNAPRGYCRGGASFGGHTHKHLLSLPALESLYFYLIRLFRIEKIIICPYP